MISAILILVFIIAALPAMAQLTPGQVLRVKPDAVHFELANEYFTPADTAHGQSQRIMTRWVADSSIAVLVTSIGSKLATAAFTAAAITTLYGYTPANPSSIPTNNNQLSNGSAYLVAADISGKKNATDSGRGTTQYATGYDLNKVRDSVQANIPSITGLVASTRTISTTSPITGGGDLSANRTFAINNAAADGSTKGAASFNADYFDDNGSGNITYAVTRGTGTVSASAVTINTPRGAVTYNSPNIIAAGTSTFTLTNSFISSTSTINVGINGNGSNLVNVNCYIKSQTSGSCVVAVQNLSLLSLFNTNMIIDFFVVN